MRNTPLGVVRSMVKAESAKSLQQSSTAQDNEINQIIADTQVVLSEKIEWPFLKTRWTIGVPAAQRYTTFPTVSDLGVTTSPVFERPENCWVKWNQIWQPVVYGIDEYPEFNYLDSDRNMVLDPVQRWQFSDENKFEVWPLPASQATLRYVGQRTLTSLVTSSSFVQNIQITNAGGGYLVAPTVTFTGGGGAGAAASATINNGQVVLITITNPGVGYTSAPAISFTAAPGGGITAAASALISYQTVFNDAATLDLDDLLVALFAAAKYLTRKESALAASVLREANARLLALSGAYPQRTDTYCIGRGEPLGRRAIRNVPLVLVAGNTH